MDRKLDELDRTELIDKIEGLTADLRSAVEVAYARGGVEWVRLNYPDDYARLTGIACDEAVALADHLSKGASHIDARAAHVSERAVRALIAIASESLTRKRP